MADTTRRDDGQVTRDHVPGPPPHRAHGSTRAAWTGALGTAVAVLAPLAGFLGGTVAGPSSSGRFDPLFLWLLVGMVVGGVGAVVAVVAWSRWYRSVRRDRVREHS